MELELGQLVLVGLVGGLGAAAFTEIWKSVAAAIRWKFTRHQSKAASDAELAYEELLPAFRRAQAVPGVSASLDEDRAYDALLDELDDALLRLHDVRSRARLERLVDGLRQHDRIWPYLPSRYALSWVVGREARGILGALARQDPVPSPRATVTRDLIPALEEVEEDLAEQARAQDEYEELHREEQRRKHRQANAQAVQVRAAASALAEDELDELAVDVDVPRNDVDRALH